MGILPHGNLCPRQLSLPREPPNPETDSGEELTGEQLSFDNEHVPFHGQELPNDKTDRFQGRMIVFDSSAVHCLSWHWPY